MTPKTRHASKTDPRTRNPGAFHTNDAIALDQREIQLLVGLVMAHYPRTILEIGTGNGTTAAHLAFLLEPDQRLVTVEKDQDRYWQAQAKITQAQSAAQRAVGHLPRVTPLHVGIEQAPLGDFAPFDLVLIDGHPEHRYDDTLLVAPHLSPGAILLYHDMGERSPGRKALDALASHGLELIEVWSPRGLVIAQQSVR